MSFSETEIKLFKIVCSNEFNLVKTDLNIINGLMIIALFRTLKQSQDPKLKYYADWIESGNYTPRELEAIIKAVYIELSKMTEKDRNNFVMRLERNTNQVFKELIEILDRDYGIGDILRSYSKNSFPPTKFLNYIMFSGVPLPGKLVMEMWHNGLTIQVDLPGRNGIFNRPEITIRVDPLKSAFKVEENNNNIMYT